MVRAAGCRADRLYEGKYIGDRRAGWVLLERVRSRHQRARFPQFVDSLANHTIRVWHPRGPDKMEIWSWAIADEAAPAEFKDVMRFVSHIVSAPRESSNRTIWTIGSR